jgi:hypothetical protein
VIARMSGDKKLAPDNDHGHPGIHHIRAKLHQRDIGGGDHQLVRQGIQQRAHGGDLAAPPRQVAIQSVCD